MGYDYTVIDALTSPYIKVYKEVIKEVGAWEAIWLGELLYRWRSMREKGIIQLDGWFFCKQKYFEESIGISKNKHTQIIKRLIDTGYIETERRGIPAKNYYRINTDKLMESLTKPNSFNKNPDYEAPRFPKTGKQESPDDGIYNIKNNDRKNNDKNLLEYKYSKKKACKQAHLRNAISLNKKKQTLEQQDLPDKQIKINSPERKQQQRLRLDIEAVQQACPNAQKLYEYWNTLGLTRHRDAPTKTKLNSFIQIQKYLNRHTAKEIRTAFDTYAKLCEKFPVKFSKQPYKVSLPDFFRWNLQQKNLVSFIPELKNLSGFVDICKLGVDYALDRFVPKNKLIDKQNKTYARMSNEASKLFGSTRARRGSVDLQRATVRLEGFYKDRKRRFDSVSVNGLVPLLFSYVESSNDIGKFKLWWLNSENTFNGFEEWLEENGYLKQLSCFDRQDTVYGKDGRIVRCALP